MASEDGSAKISETPKNRASMQEVRHYYMDYVRQKELMGYFRNHSTVTSVERVLDISHSIDCESGEQTPCAKDHSGRITWEVRGFETVKLEDDSTDVIEFCYRAPNVVLATGSYDRPNRLRVVGEEQSYVLHSLTELEDAIHQNKLNPASDPLVVVGAGLSAADAILFAQEYDIPVIHVFRREVSDPQIVFRQLPAQLYPEYHSIRKMMELCEVENLYQAYPVHNITEFLDDGKILLKGSNSGQEKLIQGSYAVVLIGSHPDLSFLPGDGRHLGVIPGVSIEAKRNPLHVDSFTYQSVYECGLYGMGPLVGDNFVRFLRGGALGITSHILKKREGKL